MTFAPVPPRAGAAEQSRRPVTAARFHFAILTHGALADTRRCLRSLQATMQEPFQVFVVDNASRDGTPEWLRRSAEPWLHWRLNPENRGVAGGRNDLLAFALPHLRPDDWLLFCDNDLEFGAGWADAFAAAMRTHPDARLFGKVGHLIELRGDRRILLPAPVRTQDVDVLSGGYACAVRADAAAAIGPFDEQLGLFWHEDDDWCVRALQRGFGVVAVPEAAIVHHEHASGVAAPGLREGGSLRNQALLAHKWRAAGCVDAGGWVRRPQVGIWQPPEVRAALQQRGGFATPIGRAEFGAAWALLDRLVAAADPVAEFVRRREPVPRCTAAWLRWNRECAATAGERELAARLAAIEALLGRESYAARLTPVVRTAERSDGPAGHGLCAPSDFDDPEWLAMADAIAPGHCMRDPHARDRVFWEDVSVMLALQRAGVLVAGKRLLFAGEIHARTEAVLRDRGLELLRAGDDDSVAAGSCDAVVVHRTFEPDAVARLLAAAHPDAVFVFVGDAALDGAPLREMPQPHQIEWDLLARAGLRLALPLRCAVAADLLEACCDSPSLTERRPFLCRYERRLLTSFVAVARSSAVPARSDRALLLPSRAPVASLRVGVDLRTVAFADSTARGIGHYTVHHLAAVARRDAGVQLTCMLPDGSPLPRALQLPNVVARHVDDYRDGDFDVVHLPDPLNLALGFDSPLRVFRHERTTVTFHDLTPLRHYLPAWPLRNRTAYLDRLQQIECSSALLLCNSQFTRDDVVATLGLDPARATAILAGHNGGGGAVDPAVASATKRRLGIRGPFVLHVGALDPHKNFAASLSAFLQVRQRTPLQLVVVGAVDPGVEYFGGFCRKKGIDDVVFTGYLPRAQLDALYADAAALLFLSRSEGFGFPLLEAMASGCPVVATGVTSHPEVVGDAGLLVAVDDPAAAAQALGRLLADPALADRLRRLGRAQATRFTWDAVAERTLAAWRELCSPANARVAALPAGTTNSP